MRDVFKAHVLYGAPLTDAGVSYSCVQISQAMRDPDLAVELYSPLDRRAKAKVIPAISGPAVLNRFPYRFTRRVAQRSIERQFLSAAGKQPATSCAYLWSNVSLGLTRALAKSKVLTIREKVNSSKVTAARILQAEYARIDASDHYRQPFLSPYYQEKEREELELADAVFCPSAFVADSLVEVGIPREKLIVAGRGFDPARLTGHAAAFAAVRGPTFLFVGFVCVRKGAHTLLSAWRDAAPPDGRLILLGEIEPLLAQRYADVLARPDVIHRRFDANVGVYYASADFLVLPTLEEGAPKVTYEAVACGVPPLVTPIGGGEVVRDGVEGRVVASNDPMVWAELLSTVDHTSAAHADMRAAALARSTLFTWDRVGSERRNELRHRIQNHAR